MEGTIALQEKRNVVDKFKSWYKEKMLDNGRSAKIEEGTVKFIDIYSDYQKIMTVIGGIAIAIVPIVVTGGSAAAFSVPLGGLVATTGPLLMELIKKFSTKVYVNGKRSIEGIFFGEAGTSENVKIPDIDLAAEAQDIGKIVMNEAPEIIAEYGKYKQDIQTSTQKAEETAAPEVEVEIADNTSIDIDPDTTMKK